MADALPAHWPALFLGRPLAIDNTLYRDGRNSQCAVSARARPSDRASRWQQQLVGLEQGIALDPARRESARRHPIPAASSSARPAASAVIAIDVVKREFAWVYRYPREAQSTPRCRPTVATTQLQTQLVRANDQWLDSSAIIADGRVLLTPPESAEIHCLDLHTGKLLWKRRQGEPCSLAASITATCCSSAARPCRRCAFPMAHPPGTGESFRFRPARCPPARVISAKADTICRSHRARSRKSKWQPASSRHDEPASPNVVLGNLICYRGSVLSQSPLVLDKFEQLDVLQKRTEAALARIRDDANAHPRVGRDQERRRREGRSRATAEARTRTGAG